MSTWNGSWSAPIELTPPIAQTSDVYLTWDSKNSRFVVVVRTATGGNESIYFGYSYSPFTTWTMSSTPVFQGGSGYDWDYPSVGVDANGRIIVGAAAGAFYTKVAPSNSTSGTSFGAQYLAAPSLATKARVVATSTLFEVFAPIILSPTYTPQEIDRYESSDGVTWAKNVVLTFAPPQNSSPGCYTSAGASVPCSSSSCSGGGPCNRQVFYAPFPDAHGSPDGRWMVVFAVNNASKNNVEICTSDRGCGRANSSAFDEFMGAGATSPSSSQYWVNYYTFTTSQNALPLITQAAYFTSGGYVGATVNSNISPISWPDFGRCADPTGCYSAGDYSGIAANPYASASTPYSTGGITVNQNFIEDPQVMPNIPNFVPNYVADQVCSDISSIGGPIDPSTYGVNPELEVQQERKERH